MIETLEDRVGSIQVEQKDDIKGPFSEARSKIAAKEEGPFGNSDARAKQVSWCYIYFREF